MTRCAPAVKIVAVSTPTDPGSGRPTLGQNLGELQASLEACKALGPAVDRAAHLIATALKAGQKLLVAGNGGSAADAMHLATEFVVRYDKDRRPYPAICLSASGGDLTAIGNDYAYENAFERQVQAFAQAGDVLVV